MVSKYVLILVLVLVTIFIWRHNRKAALKARRAQEEKNRVVDVVACRWCGVHIPQNDSVPGAHGRYCSTAHWKKAELV